jgi:hypothetical protein
MISLHEFRDLDRMPANFAIPGAEANWRRTRNSVNIGTVYLSTAFWVIDNLLWGGRRPVQPAVPAKS